VRRRGSDGGQATVEFALAIPLVVVAVLGVVQVVIVGSRQATIERLARDGARAAAVSEQPYAAARAAVERSTRLRPIDVRVEVAAPSVTVEVTYVESTSVPIVGRAIREMTLTARATMPREPP
jgi:Flp pilus assembly protein TadG